MKPPKQYDVVIVGAGMAGLGAAYTLTKAGCNNLLLLEARQEPGGRIQTVPLGNSVIDLGAQWVHGTDTTLYKLAVENHLIHPQTSDEAGGLYIRNDGFVIDDWLVKIVDFKVGEILTECENFVDTEIYPESLGMFLHGKFKQFVGDSDEDPDILWELFDWHVRFQLIDNCCSNLNELSAREWGRYSCLGKDGQAHINLKGGYKALVDVLVKSLPVDSIKLNSPVTKIAKISNNGLQLSCNNNIINSKFVIVTSSLGVLKRDITKIEVPLPEVITDTIKCMGYGGMGKIFLVFDNKWWKSDGFQLIWRRNESNPTDWTRHLSGFDPVLDQPNVLLGWVSALGLKEMEALDEESVGKQCVDLLRQFLKNEDVPYPVRVIKTSWLSCPWTSGAYSHTTPSCDRRSLGPSILRRPVDIDGVPRLLFAGEATHPSHFSTTHGAFESGELQARHILTHLEDKRHLQNNQA